jgi:hypothetical protein
MNAELETGLSDGRYKAIVKDRGGFVDKSTYDARAQLHDLYYGIHEAPVKQLPGRIGPADARTQDYRATPEADPWG